jgi:hypothetical protein
LIVAYHPEQSSGVAYDSLPRNAGGQGITRTIMDEPNHLKPKLTRCLQPSFDEEAVLVARDDHYPMPDQFFLIEPDQTKRHEKSLNGEAHSGDT